MRGDGIITGQGWLPCSQAQCAYLATALSFSICYKHIPRLPQPRCELDLAVPVNVLTVSISLGLLSRDHHHNSPFFPFFPPESVNSYCAASVLVRAGWVTPVTCYLLVPNRSVLRWTVSSRKTRLARLWEEARKLSVHSTKCSLKRLV